MLDKRSEGLHMILMKMHLLLRPKSRDYGSASTKMDDHDHLHHTADATDSFSVCS